MRIAIAGGTGTVGAHIVRSAESAGHEAVVLSRAAGVDLVTGAGLDLGGIDAVIDATGPSTRRTPEVIAFFESVTANLLRAEREAGVGHHVALSIVGAARIDDGYYAGKAAQERALQTGDPAGAVPWSILRTTQFFDFAEQAAVPVGRLLIVPKVRSRPVAAASVAARLVEIAAGEPVGIASDLAGPEELRIAELLRAILAARGESRRVLEVPLPGRFGKGLRDGTILPGDRARIDSVSAAEWIAGYGTARG